VPGGSRRGEPSPGFAHSFTGFPVPGTTARTWYLAARGTLGDRKPARARVDSFRWDAHARPLTDFTGDTAAGSGGLWTATPPYKWSQDPAGTARSYEPAPLRAN